MFGRQTHRSAAASVLRPSPSDEIDTANSDQYINPNLTVKPGALAQSSYATSPTQYMFPAPSTPPLSGSSRRKTFSMFPLMREAPLQHGLSALMVSPNNNSSLRRRTSMSTSNTRGGDSGEMSPGTPVHSPRVASLDYTRSPRFNAAQVPPSLPDTRYRPQYESSQPNLYSPMPSQPYSQLPDSFTDSYFGQDSYDLDCSASAGSICTEALPPAIPAAYLLKNICTPAAFSESEPRPAPPSLQQADERYDLYADPGTKEQDAYEIDLSRFAVPQQPTVEPELFRCHEPNCTKVYTKASTLAVHEQAHDKDRPWPCPLCPQRFSRRFDLERHGRTHTGDTPYRCNCCARGFTRSDGLTRHYKKEPICFAAAENELCQNRADLVVDLSSAQPRTVGRPSKSTEYVASPLFLDQASHRAPQDEMPTSPSSTYTNSISNSYERQLSSVRLPTSYASQSAFLKTTSTIQDRARYQMPLPNREKTPQQTPAYPSIGSSAYKPVKATSASTSFAKPPISSTFTMPVAPGRKPVRKAKSQATFNI